jgi:hypothetical protein
MLALLTFSEFLFLPPVCLAIALVPAAAHREDIGQILRHAFRAWLLLMAGIVVFMLWVSYFFEWVLPSGTT